jgi:glycine dehydrogenase
MADRPLLADLEQRDGFISRHVGADRADTAAMLEAIGFADLDEFVAATVPASIRTQAPLALAAPMPEHEAIAALRVKADRNQVLTSLIGCGYSATLTPPVILRNVLENPAWYTAYTPYQPEISQGRLEALLNFQTMVADLSGMDIANGRDALRHRSPLSSANDRGGARARRTPRPRSDRLGSSHRGSRRRVRRARAIPGHRR